MLTEAPSQVLSICIHRVTLSRLRWIYAHHLGLPRRSRNEDLAHRPVDQFLPLWPGEPHPDGLHHIGDGGDATDPPFRIDALEQHAPVSHDDEASGVLVVA